MLLSSESEMMPRAYKNNTTQVDILISKKQVLQILHLKCHVCI